METTTDNRQQGVSSSALKQFLASDIFFGQRYVPISRKAIEEALAARKAPCVAEGVDGRPASLLTAGSKEARLEDLNRDRVRNCRECRLCEGRTNTVFGSGSAQTRLVFVGEGPGFHEDRQGLPFVGQSGDLLTRMIIPMGFRREEVYICNIVKCRPPNNRDPKTDEVVACSPYLYEQLRIIDPEVIVTLGAPAAKTLLETGDGIGRLRGQFHDFTISFPDGTSKTIDLMPTYHPAYLLRSPQDKRKAWHDLQMVMKRLGMPLPNER